MPTLNEAHERAVNGDRKLQIHGTLTGYWYEDHVIEYVNEHGHQQCRVDDETDCMVTVTMIKGGL